VLASLLTHGLIREKGKHTVLTKAGLPAIGREQPAPVAADGAPRRTRENTKQATVIRMLQRPEGATVRQICETSGWQAHTVRGTFAGTFRNKLGLTIISDKTKGGERVYWIS
jgi:hypothetical protein